MYPKGSFIFYSCLLPCCLWVAHFLTLYRLLFGNSEMAMSFSIVHELPPSHWGCSHMPNKTPKNWEAILNSMRSLWESGVVTELETAFVEQIRKPTFPYGKLG